MHMSCGSCESKESLCKKYFAEFLGTFALVFFGCGSAVIAGYAVGFLGIAFAFGVTVLIMAYAIGPISGCHINPAVTISMWFARKINNRDMLAYIISQCIGGIIGAFFLLQIAAGRPDYNIGIDGLGQNGFGAGSPAGYGMGAAFVAEVLLTFFFLIVIHGATSSKANPSVAGVAIGLALFVVHIFGIPITGTSVNPARSLGPAVWVGGLALEQLWLFWLAPIIGGILAAYVWKLFGKD